MGQFKTQMQATVRVPQEGFTLDDLKKHMRETRVPLDARLIPTNVRDVDPSDTYDSQFTPEREVPEKTEVAFIAEWSS